MKDSFHGRKEICAVIWQQQVRPKYIHRTFEEDHVEGQNLPLLQRLAFGMRMGLGQGILHVT